MTAQRVGSAALTPAEISTRLIAYIVDAVVLSIVYLVLITAIVVGAFIQGDAGVTQALSRSILFALASFLYFGWGWTHWRATPGQRAMGVMTVNAADGSTMTWNQSALRWAYLFGPSAFESLFTNSQQVGGLISFVAGVAVLAYYVYLYRTSASDPKRQGFHDKQSGTIVVKAAA